MLSENEGREYCMNCGNIQSIPGRSKCDVCGNGDLGIVVTSQIDQDIRDQMERERMGEIDDAIELDKSWYQGLKEEQSEAEIDAILWQILCREHPLPVDYPK